MDWTGGSRKRFAGGRGKTAPNRVQKAHFARVRSHRSRLGSTEKRSSANPTVSQDHAHVSDVETIDSVRSLPYPRGAKSSSRKGRTATDDQRRPLSSSTTAGDSTANHYDNGNIMKHAKEAQRTGNELDQTYNRGATSFDLELQLMQKRNSRFTDRERTETLLRRPLKLRRSPTSGERLMGRRRRVEKYESVHRRNSAPRPTATRPLFRSPPADIHPHHLLDSLRSAEIEFRIGSDALYSQSRSPVTPRPHTSLRALSSRDHPSSNDGEMMAHSWEAFQPTERYIGDNLEQMEEQKDSVHNTASSPIMAYDAQSDVYNLPNFPSPILQPWTENDNGLRQELQSGGVNFRALWSSLTTPMRHEEIHEVYHENCHIPNERAWRDMMNISHTSEGATSTRSIASGENAFLSDSTERLSLPDPFETWHQSGVPPLRAGTSTSDVNGFWGDPISTSVETSPWRKFVFGTSREVKRGMLSSPEKISTMESWNQGLGMSPVHFPSPVVSGLGTSICGNAEEDFPYRY